MNLSDLFNLLEKLLPIIGTISNRPELAALVQKLVDLAEDEIARRQAENPNATREEVLLDARKAYAEAKIQNEKLKQLGHEAEQG